MGNFNDLKKKIGLRLIFLNFVKKYVCNVLFLMKDGEIVGIFIVIVC